MQPTPFQIITLSQYERKRENKKLLLSLCVPERNLWQELLYWVRHRSAKLHRLGIHSLPTVIQCVLHVVIPVQRLTK